MTLSLIEMKLRIPGLAQNGGSASACAAPAAAAPPVAPGPGGRSGSKVPACPRGRKVAFGADYAFLGGKTITKQRKVSCSRFLDLPSDPPQG